MFRDFRGSGNLGLLGNLGCREFRIIRVYGLGNLGFLGLLGNLMCREFRFIRV